MPPPVPASSLNQWFYLPIWVVALLGALLAGRIGWWLNRAIAGLVCVGLASLGLPGYPEVLTAYKVPDFRLQFYISLLVMLAVALLTLLRAGAKAGSAALAGANPAAGECRPAGGLPDGQTCFTDALQRDAGALVWAGGSPWQACCSRWRCLSLCSRAAASSPYPLRLPDDLAQESAQYAPHARIL